MADVEELDLSMAGERCDDAVLPCPFCGSKNIAYGKYEHTAGRRYAIVCMNCMAQIDPGWAQSWGALQEMWNRRSQPANEPLTLEQLREMDGEPVWLERTDSKHFSGWNLVRVVGDNVLLIANDGGRILLDGVETNRVVYCRPPEGSEE